MTTLIVMFLPNCYCGDFSAILYVYIEGEGVTNSKVILLLLSPIAEVGGVSTNKSGVVTKVDAKKLLLLHVCLQGNMDLGFVPDLNFGPQETAVTRDDCYSGGGRREASLLRYKEKRRARLFSKKIRYEVRKLNAEQRPRMRVSFNLHLFNLSFFLNLFSSWIIYSLETCALGLFSRQLNCFFHILTRE
jgi:hypothetical protein